MYKKPKRGKILMKKSKALSRTVWIAVIAIVIIIIAGVAAVWYLTQPRPFTVYSLWDVGSEAENFQKALESFTDNTGINVRHVGLSTDELLTTIPIQLQAGEVAADVVIAPWPSWILNLAGDGLLTDVSSMIDTSKFPQTFLNTVSAGGETYGVPFKVTSKPGFWYRKSFFSNNGLTVPNTYEEFKTLLADISMIDGVEAAIASGIDPAGWPLSDTTEAFIIGLGGYQLQEDLIFGDTPFTSSEVKDVFEELASLLEAGYFSVPDNFDLQVQRVWDGTYGIYFQGSFITAFEPFASNLGDVSFFPFPETDGVTGSVDYVIMPTDTPYPEEARQLVEFLGSAEAQEIMVQQGGFLAPNMDVPDSAYSSTDLEVVQFTSTVTVVPDLDDAIGGTFQQTFWDELKAFWVDPTRDIDTMLQNFQDDWTSPGF
jgi:multiple sugar transport system substrate-binding protein